MAYLGDERIVTALAALGLTTRDWEDEFEEEEQDDEEEDEDVRGGNVEIELDDTGSDNIVVKHSLTDGPGMLQFSGCPLSESFSYFEIKIIRQHNAVGLGLASNSYPTDKFPGWLNDSIAFHCDDGRLYFEGTGRGRPFAISSNDGDRVGCGIDLSARVVPGHVCVVFTRNGSILGHKVVPQPSDGFYLTIGLGSFGDTVQLLLDAEWPIDSRRPAERVQTRRQVEQADIDGRQNFSHVQRMRSGSMRLMRSASPPPIPGRAGRGAVSSAMPSAAAVAEGSGGLRRCPYRDRCRRYLTILKIPKSCLDPTYDKCYCSRCYQGALTELRGYPSKPYGIPLGWVRFGLKLDSRLDSDEIFATYHVAFHGTSAAAAKSIVEGGMLLLPGDTTHKKFTIPQPAGHIRDGTCSLVPVRLPDKVTYRLQQLHYPGCPCGCKVFNPSKMFFTSPSIRYCEHPAYAVPGEMYEGKSAKVVLQVRQSPDSYLVMNETVGETDKGRVIDRLFSNSEMEWCTQCRYPAIVLTGLMIKME